MPERLIRPRRPVGWNQLLRKGHAHAARTSGRGADRRALDSEVEDALAAREEAGVDDLWLPELPHTRR